MYIRNKFLFFLIAFIISYGILLPVLSMAQSEDNGSSGYFEQDIEVRKLDERKWKTITRDLDYTNEKQSGRKKKRLNENGEEMDDDAERTSEFEEDSEQASDPPPATYFNLGQAGQIIIYGLAILLIAFIVYKLVGGNLFSSPKNEEIKKPAADLFDEEIHESDLERYLREALNKKEYKLAIRIYYLMILKELSIKNWIHWKKEKTNKEYLSEMSNREDYRTFFETTRLLEKVWYGDSEINESDYLAISPVFKTFVEGIKRKDL